ncbi:hypothetical protein J2795_002928 [Chryseobacterium bernardetii]|jgi:hypothetical protein|uniref:GLPGLI family protein n=2 Tax=Chryseobacterium TaxID=59732 RepID=A0A543EBX4_9FLAO|nr:MULTISPECIES: hypothetical protein [Chryseobacterium]MDR6371285.1 hypothetical protein [Chryseobacterium vietnamense]MDR6442210.1 hypothetical protein [Chryseobacterium bernardetii]TQM19087.1 hypothetical protein FB551_3482 [Chryseobacterium aquifrigidense]
MKTLFKFIFFIFIPLQFSAQDALQYDFKKQVNYVFQGSLYEAFQEAVTNYNSNSKEYIQSDILPLKFATQHKESKNKNYTIKIEDFPNQYNIKFKFDQYENSKENCLNFLEIDTNKLFIQSQKDNSGVKYINTYLNSFMLSSSCDNDNTKTWISKSFLCKTHVISNEYIDINKDFKIINILYYNTLSLTSNSAKNKFEITIYEKVDRQMNLLMRKTIIKGNKEDAIDYLKRYNINYNSINDKEFQEQDFKKI